MVNLQKVKRQTSPPNSPRTSRIHLAIALLATLFCVGPVAVKAATPVVGQKAPDFTLSTPEGSPIHLTDLTRKGTVVLIVLRGYPGYQCPYCQRQAHDFIQNGDKFAQAGAQVLLVYPGPPAELSQKATEFLAGQALPPNVHLVIDPDYAFTNLYSLRWDAPKETAYPSTFLIDRNRSIFFAKTSHTHGDRTTADDTLTHLPKTQ